MAQPLAALEDLPDLYGRIARDIRRASEEWTERSWEALPQGIIPAVTTLRSAALQTRIFVTLDQRRLWFGFGRRSRSPEVLLDCDVAFAVTPALERPSRPPLRPASILHEVWMPPFLAAEPAAADRKAAAATAGARPEELEFLRLDRGWLAATAGDMDDIRMAWRLDTSSGWNAVIETGLAPGGRRVRRWQIPPFLALARTVGRWIRGLDPSVRQSIAAPPPADPETIAASLFVLSILAAAWAESVNELEDRGTPRVEAATGMLPPPYSISGYRAEVRLMVDESGRLVRRQGHPEALQLRGRLEASEDNWGVAKTKITIDPPDFLAAGPLFDAFLDEIATPESAARIASQIGFRGQEEAVRGLIAFARRSQSSAPLVFRVRRGKQDTNLIVLHGLFLGRSVHLVLRAAFTVDAANAEVTLEADSLEVLLTFPPVDPAAAISGQPEVLAEGFFRLMRLLLHWRSALA